MHTNFSTPAMPDQSSQGALTAARHGLKGRALVSIRVLYFVLFILLLLPFSAGVPGQFKGSTLGNVAVKVDFDPAGRPVLWPAANSKTAQAGLQGGEVLLAVDGATVSRWTTDLQIQVLLNGPVGSVAKLELLSADGDRRLVTLVREAKGLAQLGISPAAYGRFLTIVDSVLVLGFLVPALIVLSRKSDDHIGIFLSIVLVIIALGNTSEYLSFIDQHPGWTWWLFIFVFLYRTTALTLFYNFPDGNFVPKWTGKLVLANLLWGVLHLLPYPYHPLAWTRYLVVTINLLFFATGIYAQVYRYHRVSNPIQKQQTKWVVFGFVAAVLVVFGSDIPLYLQPELVQADNMFYYRYTLIGRPISSLALLVIPVTLMLAILRHRLYDIDLIINRTLVYVPLTAILAGQYSASITLSQRIFIALTGQKSDTAIVLATLFVASVFAPLKNFLQTKVDKHFKENPDPYKRLELFAEQIQKRVLPVETTAVTRQLLEEAIRAFDPTSAAVFWGNEPNSIPLHMTVNWDGEAQIEIPFKTLGNQKTLGRISLGPRRNAEDYSLRDLQSLDEVAQIMSTAILQDQALTERLERKLKNVYELHKGSIKQCT